MKYKVEPDGSITYGSRVVLQNPEQASANMIAELLQEAADQAYRSAVEDCCQNLQKLINGAPDENRETLVQRSTNHGRHVGP